MGMHNDLPIYKAAFNLLSMAVDITKNLPRDLKAGLGAKVRDECISLLILIARANSAVNKMPHLMEMVERVQVVEFLLRIFVEKRYISPKQHANAIQIIVSISKQAAGWKKSAASPVV